MDNKSKSARHGSPSQGIINRAGSFCSKGDAMDDRKKFADDSRILGEAAEMLAKALNGEADTRFTGDMAERLATVDLDGMRGFEVWAVNVGAECLGLLEENGAIDETDRADIVKAQEILAAMGA